VLAVAVRVAFSSTEYHRAHGRKTGGDDGDTVLNHGNGTGQHSLIASGIIGADDC
jgi:hypothetical protein